MGKFYPPIINEKLPAVYGEKISIPFLLNRAMGETQITKMSLIITTLQSNTVLYILNNGSWRREESENLYYADFNLINENYKTIKLNVGQYYKVQLAFIDTLSSDKEQIGDYSSIGILKYTKKPKVEILNLDKNYYSSQDFVGQYSNEDLTEKPYSYEFVIKDNNDNVIISSGEQLHNSQLNYNLQIKKEDIWSSEASLEKGKIYWVSYIVKTINDLKIESRPYRFIMFDTVDLEINCVLNSELNYDNGYITIGLIPQVNRSLTGSYIICRSSNEDNFQTWEELYRFSLNNFFVEKDKFIELCKDFSIKHGITYRYSIEAYNDKEFHSNKIISNNIKSIFEDAFLFDGDRQLRIRFNPKVTTFKQTVLESKVDSIGGKYPFIFRNGNVQYKEFQLSGLLSFLSDENKLFFEEKEILEANKDEFSQTDLTDYNIYQEKEFRLKVLDWLTNGKEKVFKSPTEGNYIVRLMNTSLTPNDTVGRMLYTFNSTVYEMDNFSLSNLKKYNFIKYEDFESKVYGIKQYQINFAENDKLVDGVYYFDENAFNFQIYTKPYDKYRLYFADFTNLDVTIGRSGVYAVPAEEIAVTGIKALDGSMTATIEYQYLDNKIYNFGRWSGMKVLDCGSQFNGNNISERTEKNIIKLIHGTNDSIKKEINKISYLRLERNPAGQGTNSEDNAAKIEFLVGYDDQGDPITTEEIIRLPRVDRGDASNLIPKVKKTMMGFEMWADEFNEIPISITIGKNLVLDLYYQLKVFEE